MRPRLLPIEVHAASVAGWGVDVLVYVIKAKSDIVPEFYAGKCADASLLADPGFRD